MKHFGMRLRMKVYEHAGHEYLVAMGIRTPDGGVQCCCMSESDTFCVDMTVEQWNGLEFRWFQDMGEAPRRSEQWPTMPPPPHRNIKPQN